MGEVRGDGMEGVEREGGGDLYSLFVRLRTGIGGIYIDSGDVAGDVFI